MYQIELIRGKRPVALNIINLEVTIRRDPPRLDRTQIHADDLGGGIFVRHIQRPDSGARPEIEDFLRWGGREIAEVQTLVEREEHLVVDNVEALLLLLVVGEDVGAVAEGVVAPAVFVAVGDDGGADAGGAAGDGADGFGV